MAADPSVSVVIPVRNGERHLGEAIDSVLAQTRPVLEVLVVDDGSTDGTRELAEGYGGAVRRLAQATAGPGAARNRGVEEARGSHVAFLDHDDRWSHDKLERQLAAFGEGPGVDLVFGHMREFLSPELDPDVAATIVCSPDARPAHLPSALLARRETLLRVGGFGTASQATEVLVFLVRSEELGLRRVTVPDTVLWRRLHDANFHVRNPTARAEYARALKASLDRRRARGAL